MKIFIIGYNKLKCSALRKLWTDAILGTIGNNELKIFTDDIHSHLNNGIPEKFFTDKNFDNADIYVNFDHPSNISKEIPKEAVRIGYLGHLKVKKDLEEIRKSEYDAFFTELLPEELPIELPKELMSFFNAKSITLPIPQSVDSISNFNDSPKTRKVTLVYDSRETSFHDSNEEQSKYSFKSILPVFKNIEHFQVFDVANENLDHDDLTKAIFQSSAIIMHNLSPGLASYISIISLNAKAHPIFWEKSLLSPFRFPPYAINGARLIEKNISDFNSLREAINHLINSRNADLSKPLKELSIAKNYSIVKEEHLFNLNNDSIWQSIPSSKTSDTKNPQRSEDIWIIKLQKYFSIWDKLEDNLEKQILGNFIADTFALFLRRNTKHLTIEPWLYGYEKLKVFLPSVSEIYELLIENNRCVQSLSKEQILSIIWFLAAENKWEQAENFIEYLVNHNHFLDIPYFRFIHENWKLNNLRWLLLNPNWTKKNLKIVEKGITWAKKDLESQRVNHFRLPGPNPLAITIFLCHHLLTIGLKNESLHLFREIKDQHFLSDLYYAFLLWIYNEPEESKIVVQNIPLQRILQSKRKSVFYITLYSTLSFLHELDVKGIESLNYLDENYPDAFTCIQNETKEEFLILAILLKYLGFNCELNDFLDKHLGSAIPDDDVSNFLLAKVTS
jgi:hypothetical protein